MSDMHVGDEHAVMINDERAPRKVWERRDDENATWFARFQIYLQQNKPRSLLALYNDEREKNGEKKRDTFPAIWAQSRDKYEWRARADAYDREQARLEQEQHDKTMSDIRKLRAQQRLDEENAEIEWSKTMRKKAEEYISLSVTEEVVKYNRDGEIVDMLLVPNHKALVAAVALLKEAKQHARDALSMYSKIERQEQTGKDGEPIRTENKTDVSADIEQVEKLLELIESATTAGSR